MAENSIETGCFGPYLPQLNTITKQD